MTFCGQCGTRNPNINKFCLNCGARLFNSYEEYAETYGEDACPEEQLGTPVNNTPRSRPQGYRQNGRLPRSASRFNLRSNSNGQRHSTRNPEKPFSLSNIIAPPGQVRLQTTVLEGSPKNNINFRWIGMGLSAASFIITIVALFAISLSGNGVNYGSLFGIGTDEGGGAVLALAIITLILGIIAIFVPIANFITGISLIGAFTLVSTNSAVYPSIDSGTLLIFILLAILIIFLGIITTIFVFRYVRSNVRNVSILECSIFLWIGKTTLVLKRPKEEPVE